MIAVDTNVWARAYLNDDAAQADIARAFLREACASGTVFVPLIVLVELFWVLRVPWSKERVLTVLEHLVKTEGVVAESSAVVAKAIQDARSGSIGFADHLISEISLAHGATELVTFDKALGRRPRVRRLL